MLTTVTEVSAVESGGEDGVILPRVPASLLVDPNEHERLNFIFVVKLLTENVKRKRKEKK